MKWMREAAYDQSGRGGETGVIQAIPTLPTRVTDLWIEAKVTFDSAACVMRPATAV
jgi:hypothetical protein